VAHKHEYAVRDLVQLTRQAPWREVIWCGWAFETSKDATLRCPVYRLDDGHWDCHPEAQLYPAG
jgi:hypothetical protein